MKNSELYHMAQIAVINSPCIAPETKIEIIRMLIADENLARYSEKREEKKNAETV